MKDKKDERFPAIYSAFCAEKLRERFLFRVISRLSRAIISGFIAWIFMAGQIAFAQSYPNRPTVAEIDEKAALGAECINGVNERAQATQYRSDPEAYGVAPLFIRTDPDSGWYLDSNTMAAVDNTIKALIPYYLDSNTVHEGSSNFSMLTVTGAWAKLRIGNGTNKFTQIPAGADANGVLWPATYGAWPWRIYIANLQERYKASWIQQQTMENPNVPKPWLEHWYGVGYGENAGDAYTDAKANYSNITALTVSGNLNPDARGIYRWRNDNTYWREDEKFMIWFVAGSFWQITKMVPALPIAVWDGQNSVFLPGEYFAREDATGTAFVAYTPVPVEQYCRTMYWSNFVYPDRKRAGLTNVVLSLRLTNNLLAGAYSSTNFGSSTVQFGAGYDWVNTANVSSNDDQEATPALSSEINVEAYGGYLNPDVSGRYRQVVPNQWARDDRASIVMLGEDPSDPGVFYTDIYYRFDDDTRAVWRGSDIYLPILYEPILNSTGRATAAYTEVNSKWLEVSSFGFNVPQNSRIDEIAVEAETYNLGVNSLDGYVCLSGPGAENSLTNVFSWSGYLEERTTNVFGGLWGITNLSAENVNDPAFGCKIKAVGVLDDEAINAGLDYVSITVSYTVTNDWPDPSGDYVVSTDDLWWSPGNEPDCDTATIPADWMPTMWTGTGRAQGWNVFELQDSAYISKDTDILCEYDPSGGYCKPTWRKQYWAENGPTGTYIEVVGPPGLTGIVSAAYHTECGYVTNLVTNTWNGKTIFYQVWLNKAVCLNDSYASPNIEHKVDYWYKPDRMPGSLTLYFGIVDGVSRGYPFTGQSFYHPQSSGLGNEDVWSLPSAGIGDWSFNPQNLSRFGGSSDAPLAPPEPTNANTFNIQGFVLDDEKVIKNWRFQFTTNKFWSD